MPTATYLHPIYSPTPIITSA